MSHLGENIGRRIDDEHRPFGVFRGQHVRLTYWLPVTSSPQVVHTTQPMLSVDEFVGLI